MAPCQHLIPQVSALYHLLWAEAIGVLVPKDQSNIWGDGYWRTSSYSYLEKSKDEKLARASMTVGWAEIAIMGSSTSSHKWTPICEGSQAAVILNKLYPSELPSRSHSVLADRSWSCTIRWWIWGKERGKKQSHLQITSLILRSVSLEELHQGDLKGTHEINLQ